MKVNLNDIKIAKSAITDNVYAGITSKDNLNWESKIDVTAYFMRAVVDMFCGYKQEFILGDKKYFIKCQEVKHEPTDK